MPKQHEISRKYLLLLILYGIIIFSVFFVILFPKEKAARQAMRFLSGQLNCTLTAKDIHIGFPGQLEIENLTIKDFRAKAFPDFQIDTVQIRPKLSQLFSRRLVLLFNLHLYQGDLEGTASFDLFHPRILKKFECQAQGIQLASLKQIRELLDLQVTGKLSGQAKVRLEKNNPLTLYGDYSFEVTPGEARIMSFPNFTFQRINGDGSLNQGTAKIRSVRIEGDDLQAQGTGDLRLNQNIVKSYLKARVQLHFSQQLREKLGPLASFLPKPSKEGINLMIKGNLNKLSFMPI